LPETLPRQALFTLCHLGETITVIDADTWSIAGHIRHPEIRSTSDLALNDRGILYLTRDGDLDEYSETLIPIDLTTRTFLDYIVLGQAPYRIAISRSGIAVVSHIAILPQGRSQVSFVDTHTNRKVNTQIVDGSATYVTTRDHIGYVLVAAWTPLQENHVLVYDLDDFHVRRKYPLPSGHISLSGNFVIGRGKMYYISFNEDAPGNKFKIVELHLSSGRTRVVTELPTAGELGLLSNGNLIVSSGDYQPDTPLRLINPSNGKVLKELFVARNTDLIRSVGKDMFAVNAVDDNTIFIVDAARFEVLKQIHAPCKPFVLQMHFAGPP
ncbi:MAG: hypothetical protein GXO55_04755, partial [Chloroflexi bacterium]|nr:hypothetical protein [Chloroflexota bacterium]